MNTNYAVIMITQQPGEPDVETHVHGNLPRHLLDEGLDEAKRQISTYEETPLDAFLKENGVKLRIYRTDGQGLDVRASLEASLRDPRRQWGLLQASAEGSTPAIARRNLAERISGGTLVLNACLPTSRDIQVPDLNGGSRPGQKGPGTCQIPTIGISPEE